MAKTILWYKLLATAIKLLSCVTSNNKSCAINCYGLHTASYIVCYECGAPNLSNLLK